MLILVLDHTERTIMSLRTEGRNQIKRSKKHKQQQIGVLLASNWPARRSRELILVYALSQLI